MLEREISQTKKLNSLQFHENVLISINNSSVLTLLLYFLFPIAHGIPCYKLQNVFS